MKTKQHFGLTCFIFITVPPCWIWKTEIKLKYLTNTYILFCHELQVPHVYILTSLCFLSLPFVFLSSAKSRQSTNTLCTHDYTLTSHFTCLLYIPENKFFCKGNIFQKFIICALSDIAFISIINCSSCVCSRPIIDDLCKQILLLPRSENGSCIASYLLF